MGSFDADLFQNKVDLFEIHIFPTENHHKPPLKHSSPHIKPLLQPLEKPPTTHKNNKNTHKKLTEKE